MGATVAQGFSWPVRVYYEDTDAGGVVYHSYYLNYCERARTEWLRSIGVEQTALMEDQKVIFVVHHLEASYLKPAKFNDSLTVKTTITNVSAASIMFDQVIQREDVVLFKATVKVVCVDAAKMRAMKIPSALKATVLAEVPAESK